MFVKRKYSRKRKYSKKVKNVRRKYNSKKNFKGGNIFGKIFGTSCMNAYINLFKVKNNTIYLKKDLSFEKSLKMKKMCRFKEIEDDDGKKVLVPNPLKLNIQDMINKKKFEIIGKSAFSNSFWKEIIIPEGITKIDDYAFSGCEDLKIITLPESLTIIGDAAFNGCEYLSEFVIPDSVTSIGENVFRSCYRLESVIIGNSIPTIRDSEFFNMHSLRKVQIGNSVTSIGERAFSQCFGLKSVVIPDSVTSIGEWAFFWCSLLESVVIGNGVTSIGEYAFRGCNKLASVVIGKSVKHIGSGAFNWCNNLQYIELPDNSDILDKLKKSFDEPDPHYAMERGCRGRACRFIGNICIPNECGEDNTECIEKYKRVNNSINN
jgi:hypothetical protein